MKKMKRLVSLLLVVVMVICMTACGDNGVDKGETSDGDKATGTNPQKHKIAVLVGGYTTEILAVKDYLENYIADGLNIEFLFSEELGNDTGTILNYIENAYSGGAEAVIDCGTQSAETLKVIADKCEELGIYLVSWLSPVETMFDGYEYMLGAVGKSPEHISEQFHELIKNVLDDGKEPHSVVVCTMMAKQGNVQHIQSSCAILNALKEMYGLKYADKVENLVKLDSVTEIETGRDDVKITIFPSFNADDMNEVMKSGDYDTVAILGGIYLRFESTIAEIEQAYNKNIKVITITSIDDATKNSYQTKDVTGDTSLNGTLLTNLSQFSLLAAMAVNAVNGDADAVMKDGKATDYYTPMWICNNAEEYETICTLDQDEKTYVYTIDDWKQMIKYYNEDMSPETFEEWAEKAAVDSVIERRGLK